MTVWKSQSNVATLHQLYAAGITRDTVRWRLTVGRWQSPHPRVVILHSGTPTLAQKRWAALLWAGDGAVLSHATAAELDGLTGHEDARIHVCIPADRRLTRRPGIVVHRSHDLGKRDVHPHRRPRRTRIDRSLADLAGQRSRADDAIAVLAAGIQQGLVRPEQLQQRIRDSPRLRHRHLLLDALVDLAGGSQSLPELEVLRLIRRFGLPEPRVQRRRGEDGRWRYLDVYWEEYDLCLEIDGAFHMEVTTWWADMERDFEIGIEGTQIIRIPARWVRHDGARLMEGLTRALVARGWQIPPDKGVVVVLPSPRRSIVRRGYVEG